MKRIVHRCLAVALLLGPSLVRAATVDAAAVVAMHGLRSTTKRLAGPGLRGRDNGTTESLAAQTYLIRRLRRLGHPLRGDVTGDEAFKQPFTFGVPPQPGSNLLAVIPGSDLANEYVVVGAHYDHLDTRSDGSGHCRALGTPGGAVCPGATDNATGAAAVLAIGRALRSMPTPPRRSVVLALWDAEEDGLQGSLYYVNHPLVPIAQTVAYVNFDILGASLSPSIRNLSFSVGAETGGALLEGLVHDAAAVHPIDVVRLTYLFGQLRSDYANFINAQVPTVFFSDSTGGCYHTTGDDLSVVNLPKLRQQSAVGFRVVEALAGRPATPMFVPPEALARYADAVAIAGVLALGVQDIGLLTPPDRIAVTQVKAALDAIVADGPASFDAADVTTVLNAALTTIGALTRVPCQPF